MTPAHAQALHEYVTALETVKEAQGEAYKKLADLRTEAVKDARDTLSYHIGSNEWTTIITRTEGVIVLLNGERQLP